MVQSLNTKVDMVVDGTSFMGLTDYGKIMIGDKGFEFYHNRDPRKFIQIPWDEVNLVFVSVVLKGKWIPRFAIETKRNGTYTFSSKKPKVLLRTMRKYVSPSRMLPSPSFFSVVKNGMKALIKK